MGLRRTGAHQAASAFPRTALAGWAPCGDVLGDQAPVATAALLGRVREPVEAGVLHPVGADGTGKAV